MVFLAELRFAGRAAFAFLPQTVSFGVVEDAAHDRAHAMHGPPRIERRMQPIFDRFWLNLIESYRAPPWNDVPGQVEGLFFSSRFGDLVLPAKVPLHIHRGNLGEHGDAGDRNLLDGSFDRRRVQFRQELVTFHFGLLLGDGAVPLAGADLLVFPESLYRSVR